MTDDALDDARGPSKPPYISFKTLLGLWERLEADGFPARIDKSYLESTAGGYATVVIASLRWLDFLHDDGRPTQALKDLVAKGEHERKTEFAAMLRSKYLGLEDKARANETQSQFLEYFTESWGLTGDTRRKAIAFYMAAAKWADVAVGSLWKTPSSRGNGALRKPAPRRSDPSIEPERVLPDADPPVSAHLSTALRGVLERLPKFGEMWTARERDMFKMTFDNVLEWDYPVSDPAASEDAQAQHE